LIDQAAAEGVSRTAFILLKGCQERSGGMGPPEPCAIGVSASLVLQLVR
jgi:hypothetical protein